MRTIKFRGKVLFSGEWTYGQWLPMSKTMCTETCIEGTTQYRDLFVEEETVGQFTGLYDKNGKEIYEGDIVVEQNGNVTHVVFGEVGYDYARNGMTGFALGEWKPDDFDYYILEWGFDYSDLEVIGNIHENNELLR